MIADLSLLQQTNKRIAQIHTHARTTPVHSETEECRNNGDELTTWILGFLKTLATKTLQHMRSFAENVPKKPH